MCSSDFLLTSKRSNSTLSTEKTQSIEFTVSITVRKLAFPRTIQDRKVDKNRKGFYRERIQAVHTSSRGWHERRRYKRRFKSNDV